MAENQGTQVSGPVVPFDTADTFPTHLPKFGMGGLRSVASLAAIDDPGHADFIPADRREVGMVINPTGDRARVLLGDLTTWDNYTTIQADLDAIPTFTPDSVAALRQGATSALEYDVVVRDEALNENRSIPLSTFLNQSYFEHYLSVPSGGVVLVDTDGPGGHYNRSGGVITFDCSSLSTVTVTAGKTASGSKNAKWIISEPNSTCRIDPGVNKTLNYPGCTQGDMLDLSNGDGALVFALDIATTTVGIMVIAAPAAGTSPTRVLISTAGDTTLADAAYAPATIHYTSGAGINILMPVTPSLYRPYQISAGSSAFTINPGASRQFLGMSLGEILTVPAFGSVTLTFVGSSSISILSQVPGSGSGGGADPVRINISTTGTNTIADTAYAPDFVHYVTAASVNLIMPVDPELYRPYQASAASSPFTLDPGAGRQFLGMAIGEVLTVPAYGSVTVEFLTGSAMSILSQVPPESSGGADPIRVTISTTGDTMLGATAFAPDTIHYVTASGANIQLPTSPELYRPYQVNAASSPFTLDPGASRQFLGMSNAELITVPAYGSITVQFLTGSSAAVISLVLGTSAVPDPTRITVASSTTLSAASVSPVTIHYVTAAANVVMPVTPELYKPMQLFAASNAFTLDPGAGRQFLGHPVAGTITIAAYGSITVLPITSTAFVVVAQTGAVAPTFIEYAYFGDGADGDVTISSGTTTLTGDKYYNNLTLSGTGVLSPAGYRVFVKIKLDLEAAQAGAIIGNGTAGTNGSTTAATALTSNNLGGSSSGSGGGAGGIAAGSAGAAQASSQTVLGGDGAAGAAGGLGASGAGGAAGAAVARTSAAGPRRYEPNILRGATQPTGGQSAAGGGGGGGDGTAGGIGGTGGVGGRVLWISAGTIARGTNTTAGIIQANGGKGGNGADASGGNRGGGGGGGGAGGGCIYLAYGALTGSAITNAIQCNGGLGGNGGALAGTGVAGSGATGGDGGRIIVGDLLTNTWTNSRTGTGAAGSGVTGGAGGVNSVTL